MALETLKNVMSIDGFAVHHKPIHPDETPEKPFIFIDHNANLVNFKIQNGPIKENGVNGCQVDTMILTAALIVKGLNEKFPCVENDAALSHLEQAALALKERKINREKRGVEGTDQK